jgi:hypothetical protein
MLFIEKWIKLEKYVKQSQLTKDKGSMFFSYVNGTHTIHKYKHDHIHIYISNYMFAIVGMFNGTSEKRERKRE